MFKLLAKFQTISMKMSDDELVVTTALIQRLMGNFLKLEVWLLRVSANIGLLCILRLCRGCGHSFESVCRDSANIYAYESSRSRAIALA